jgi:hypothetical protein
MQTFVVVAKTCGEATQQRKTTVACRWCGEGEEVLPLLRGDAVTRTRAPTSSTMYTTRRSYCVSMPKKSRWVVKITTPRFDSTAA